jgi:hypothetical protein
MSKPIVADGLLNFIFDADMELHVRNISFLHDTEAMCPLTLNHKPQIIQKLSSIHGKFRSIKNYGE